jgi:transposase
MNHTTVAVDLAKNVFEIAVSHEAGKVSEQQRLSRPRLVSFFAKRPAATVLLEACGSSHFWARKIRSFGHTVVLLPPHLVKPYRRGSKTDRADTKALLEAYRNEEIRPVPVKSVNQHVLAALHDCAQGG